MVDVTLFDVLFSLFSILFTLLLQVRVPSLIILLVELRHVSVVQCALASINRLKPLSLFLYGAEFKVNLIGPRANDHFPVIHGAGVNSGKLERDLTLLTDLSLLFFVVNEEVFGQDKVPLLEADDQVYPFLDEALLKAAASRLDFGGVNRDWVPQLLLGGHLRDLSLIVLLHNDRGCPASLRSGHLLSDFVSYSPD